MLIWTLPFGPTKYVIVSAGAAFKFKYFRVIQYWKNKYLSHPILFLPNMLLLVLQPVNHLLSSRISGSYSIDYWKTKFLATQFCYYEFSIYERFTLWKCMHVDSLLTTYSIIPFCLCSNGGELHILVGYFGEMLFLPIKNFYDYSCALSSLY